MKLTKFGDSFYLLIPAQVKEYFKISEEDEYELEIKNNKIIFKKLENAQLSDFTK